MKRPYPALLRNAHESVDMPAIGETELRAKIVNGNVVVIDQNGLLIQNLVSASVSSTINGNGITQITVMVNARADHDGQI